MGGQLSYLHLHHNESRTAFPYFREVTKTSYHTTLNQLSQAGNLCIQLRLHVMKQML